MTDLIDRQALIADTYILNSWDAKIVRDWLKDCPAVDAVEVVRCKDCKHMAVVGGGYRWCKAWERIQTMGDEGYCCFGERRADNVEKTCGDCIHAKVCEMSSDLTEFSRDNVAYCQSFEEYAGIDKWLKERVPSITEAMQSLEWERKYERFKAFENAELVEVVRCKDCIFKGSWYKHGAGCDICGVSELFNVEDNDFCSYGERRADNAAD